MLSLRSNPGATSGIRGAMYCWCSSAKFHCVPVLIMSYRSRYEVSGRRMSAYMVMSVGITSTHRTKSICSSILMVFAWAGMVCMGFCPQMTQPLIG